MTPEQDLYIRLMITLFGVICVLSGLLIGAGIGYLIGIKRLNKGESK